VIRYSATTSITPFQLELLNRYLPAVLPLDNPDLRTIVTQRKVYDVQRDEFLSYDVEYALARLLSR
jgi:hypothetical protein